MKKLLITILAVVGFAALAQAQIVRPVGVVRRTTAVVKREKPTNIPWADEIGQVTQSAGVLIGSEWDFIAGLDYTAQYRFSPLISAGGGLWAGYSESFDEYFGIELRTNVRAHFLATTKPESPFQPFASLWLGYIIPNQESSYHDHNGYNYSNSEDKPFYTTLELGCDIYKFNRPLYASLNINFHTYEEEERYPAAAQPVIYDDTIIGIYLKVGMKF